MSETGLA